MCFPYFSFLQHHYSSLLQSTAGADICQKLCQNVILRTKQNQVVGCYNDNLISCITQPR